MSTSSDNPTAASSGSSGTSGTSPLVGHIVSAPSVESTASAPATTLPSTLEQLRAKHAAELEAMMELERKRLEDEHLKLVAKVNELPAFLGARDLAEVEAIIRMVRRGDKALPVLSAPILGTPIRRATSTKIIEARKQAGANMDRERALAAIRAGASAKEIKKDYGYSSAWYFREKAVMGLTKVYNRPTASAKKRGAARFHSAKS